MIPSIPQPQAFRVAYGAYVALFFLYLVVPLVVVAAFAFNDSLFPSLPWNGFTLDWFFSDREPRLGVFHDHALSAASASRPSSPSGSPSSPSASAPATPSCSSAETFPFRDLLYMLMLAPLVIPGVILGISILVFSNTIINAVDAVTGIEIDALRPGLPLVVLGQFAFLTTITTLVISARLRKFDLSLEEAAPNLGATRMTAIWTVTIPYLKPALVGAGIVAFLMSFENFNTTLMLVGSDAPLTITMYDRLREGSTPVLNAVSLLLMVLSGALGLISIFVQRDRAPR